MARRRSQSSAVHIQSLTRVRLSKRTFQNRNSPAIRAAETTAATGGTQAGARKPPKEPELARCTRQSARSTSTKTESVNAFADQQMLEWEQESSCKYDRAGEHGRDQRCSRPRVNACESGRQLPFLAHSIKQARKHNDFDHHAVCDGQRSDQREQRGASALKHAD